jgi:hypothetical protein
MRPFDTIKIRASRTDGRTGSPRCSPFLPGVTPPTIFVPHAIDSFVFAVAQEEINNRIKQGQLTIPLAFLSKI